MNFYRGVCCSYCNLQLKIYQQILPQIKKVGAKLIVISPMNPEHCLDLKNSNQLEFEVLSDVGNRVAAQYTTVFKMSETANNTMAAMGYDFNSYYDDDSGEIPVPATFVISADGIIKFASSEGGDYRERTEPRA